MTRQMLLLTILGVLTVAVLVQLSLRSSSKAADPMSPSELKARAMDASLSMDDRRAAVAHLPGRGEQGVAMVREVMASSPEPKLKSQCLLVLSDAGDFESMDEMIDGITDESTDVRAAANTAVSRMLGGMKITIGQEGDQTDADRRKQAEYYRNLYLAMQQSESFENFREYRQGKP